MEAQRSALRLNNTFNSLACVKCRRDPICASFLSSATFFLELMRNEVICLCKTQREYKRSIALSEVHLLALQIFDDTRKDCKLYT